LDSFHVNYRVILDKQSEAAGRASDDESKPQSFVQVNSLPATSDTARMSRLCWTLEQAAAASDTVAPTADVSPAQTSKQTQLHCQEFVPGGQRINLPNDTRHFELHTPGRPGIALEWDSGSLSVEPKRFSVLLELQSRQLSPGEELKATTTFHILPAE